MELDSRQASSLSALQPSQYTFQGRLSPAAQSSGMRPIDSLEGTIEANSIKVPHANIRAKQSRNQNP